MAIYSVQGLQQEARPNYEPVPAGVYDAIVTDYAFGAFNNGQGHKLDITYELTGEYKGRKVFDMIALQHSNADWAKTTQARLDALLTVNNVNEVEDWSALMNLQCAIKVYIQKDKTGEYSDKNQIDMVLPCGNAPESPQAMAPPVGFQPAASYAAKDDDIPF
jgi:hypothetical protein